MSKIEKKSQLRGLSDLVQRPSDYFKIFHLYLDTSAPISITKPYADFVSAVGTGWDGELQRIHINPYAREDKVITRHWEEDGTPLPVQFGKIYSMLLSMGYTFWSARLEVALRYNQYKETGISNLGKNDHREALIEKQERQLQRRREHEEIELS